MFVDDALIFCDGSHQDGMNLTEILLLFSSATDMIVNFVKFLFYEAEMTLFEVVDYKNLLDIKEMRLVEGLKYLGFMLKPLDYRVKDWSWLLKKCEKGSPTGVCIGFPREVG